MIGAPVGEEAATKAACSVVESFGEWLNYMADRKVDEAMFGFAWPL